MTTGYPDWLRAFLLLGKYGTTYLPVLLDANGNLYAVFKGDKGGGVLANVAVDASGQLIMVPRGASGVYLNVDANGYLGAILKAAAEVTIPDGVDVTQTSTLRQVQGKDGVTYRDLAVDANGQIIMVPRGQGGNYLAVDADGNLSAAIKGDFLGTLTPIKLDEDGQMYMYITDVPDQWGKKSNIGIGELAARIVGWPVSYDRRGLILFTENFDNGWGSFFSSAAGGAAAALYATTPLQGGYCLRLTTPASASAYVTVLGYFPLSTSITSLGLSCFFAALGTWQDLVLQINYSNSPNSYNGTVKLAQADKIVWLRNSSGGWTDVGAWTPSTSVVCNWYYLKVVIDLAAGKYKRIIIQGTEIDVSAVSIYPGASTYTRLGLLFELNSAAAAVGSCLLDCITLTTQEP